MLSISDTRKPGAMVSYITGPNAEKNYYNEHGGVWHGEGARRLGLSGTVTDEQFRDIMYGFHPDQVDSGGNKLRLVQNAGDERRDAGRDFTFSAPKSVSVIWAIGEPEITEIIQHSMHRSATAALDFMTRHAAMGRVGGGGLEREPIDMMFMLYQHGSARLSKKALEAGHAPDPQLHIHAIGANVGVREDGSTGTVIFRDIYAWKMATGVAFRVNFAWELKLAGLEIERDAEFFKIAGVPDEMVDDMSKRREEIVGLMAKQALTGGRSAEYANLATRISKMEAEFDAIRAQALKTAAQNGFTPEMIRRNREVNPPSLDAIVAAERRAAVQQSYDADRERLRSIRLPSVHMKHLKALNESRDEALKAITADEQAGRGRDLFIEAAINRAMATKAVLTEPQIYQAIFENAQGIVSLKEAEEIAAEAFGKMIALERSVLKAGKYIKEYAWTTHEMRALEIENREMLGKIAIGNREIDPKLAAATLVAHLAAQAKAGKPSRLNEGQLAVIKAVSESRLVVVVGDAGTGKSTSMSAARALHEAAGYRVIGVAPIGKAVGELKKSSEIEDTFTLDSMLIQVKNKKLTLTKNDFVIVDEAGLMGTRQAHELYKVILASGAKLALVGDDKQTQPYNAGNAFPAAVKVVFRQERLIEILRQSKAHDAEALKRDIIHMREGEAALAMLGRLHAGHVHVVKDEKDMAGAITAQYVDLHDKQLIKAKTEGSRVDPVFAYARTNERVNLLNQEIRAVLKARGDLSDATTYKNLHGHKIEIAVGDRVMVDKNDYRKVNDGKGRQKAKLENANGDTGTVIAATGEEITVTFDGGETKSLKVAEAGVRYGYATTVAKSQGSSPENTVIWGSVDMSREDSYTAITRAKLEGHWYFSNNAIEKLSRGAPVPPDWLKAARRIEKSRLELGLQPDLDASEHRNFNAVRSYLIKHGEHLLQKKEQHGALDTLKTIYQQRGETSATIEKAVAFAKEGIVDNRAHAGRVVAHGKDHFEHDPENNLNYFVKLALPDGRVQTVWGKDLERNAEEGRIAVGSQVLLSYRGSVDVTVLVDERDDSGRKTGQQIPLETVRNEWSATEVGELAKQAQQAPAKATATQPAEKKAVAHESTMKPADGMDSKARVEAMLATPHGGAYAVNSPLGKLADTLHAMSTSDKKVNVEDYELRDAAKAIDGQGVVKPAIRKQHPAVETMRALYEQRGAAPEAVEQVLQLASGSFVEGRAYAGRITDHGAAPYDFDEDNSQSYYITLGLPDGSEHTVWGADFKEAAEAEKLNIGEDVFIGYQGSQPVTVPGPGGEPIATHRNTFDVQELGAMLERVAIPQAPELAKAEPVAERAVPAVSIAR